MYHMCANDSEKAHENRLTVIKDTAEQEMTTLRQTNLRRLQELNAEIQRFEIEMREMEEVRHYLLTRGVCMLLLRIISGVHINPCAVVLVAPKMSATGIIDSTVDGPLIVIG